MAAARHRSCPRKPTSEELAAAREEVKKREVDAREREALMRAQRGGPLWGGGGW